MVGEPQKTSAFDQLKNYLPQVHVTLFLGSESLSDDEVNQVFRRLSMPHVRIYPLTQLSQVKPKAGEPLSHVYGYIGSPRDCKNFVAFAKELLSKDHRPYFFVVSGAGSVSEDDLLKNFAGHCVAVVGDRTKHVEVAVVHASAQAVAAAGMDHWYEQWSELKKSTDEMTAEAYQFQQEQNEVIRFTKLLAEKLDAQEVAKIACQFMTELFKASCVGFLAYDVLTDTLRLTYVQGQGNFDRMQKGIEVGLRGKRNPLAYFETFMKDATLTQAVSSGTPIQFYPTYVQKEILGVFFVGVPEGEAAFKPHVLAQLLQYFTVSYQNATLHGEITNLATRDGLTKLHNVRYFHEQIAAEFNRMERLKHPLGLIFLDIDNFKNYNDTHGHPMGDKVIQQTAELIKKHFRPSDIFARYGGEEFVVAMPHANLEDTFKRAKQLCELVEKTPYPNEETQPLGRVTISVGVSAFPEVANDVKNLLQSADAALYQVKQSGRNGVRKAMTIEGHVPLFEPRQDYSQSNA